MKKITVLVLIAVLSVTAVLSAGIWFLFYKSDTYYYTQIDSSKMAENENAGKGGVIDFTGGMRYLYTLDCYDKEGKEKSLTFGASKELKNEAFLKLAVSPIRGVIAWEEVELNELPDAVREKYNIV